MVRSQTLSDPDKVPVGCCVDALDENSPSGLAKALTTGSSFSHVTSRVKTFESISRLLTYV